MGKFDKKSYKKLYSGLLLRKMSLQTVEFKEYKADSNDHETKELLQVLHDLQLIKEINESLYGEIKIQNDKIETINENVEKTNETIEISNTELTTTFDYYKSYMSTKATVVSGAVIVVTLPITVLVGIKTGLIVAMCGLVGGSLWLMKK